MKFYQSKVGHEWGDLRGIVGQEAVDVLNEVLGNCMFLLLYPSLEVAKEWEPDGEFIELEGIYLDDRGDN